MLLQKLYSFYWGIKTSIGRETTQLLRKIAVLGAEHNIELQAHSISTNENSWLKILLLDQYAKMSN